MNNVFVCVDCETTGLDTKKDSIIEIAAATFKLSGVIATQETLVDPKRIIPEESIEIHNISQDMVEGKPTIDKVLPEYLDFIGDHIIVGHGIKYDIDIIYEEALRHKVPCKLNKAIFVDTLRLARLYGESPSNSLEMLRKHFNIPEHGAHRAMSDVLVNIEVFKHLVKPFRSKKELLDRLLKPIPMKNMPLGKHKGRPFKEIPIEYLQWAGHQKFDQDLLFSIRSEIKRRKKGPDFRRSANPFANL
ncbi:MAG: 3'-5' exonuclease DinG [Chlamydiia bacterium]|nr:3'-5' exonuclease DinG [Chlamydiia bacterium]MCH9616487.1 3'-5' exonuclease DinG [Chlamydiia bacterium]MCH9629527.1 3'-5' exonuclease DinG [Chlamydiia bacterium]